MQLIELTGFLAGGIVAISLIPQVYKSWKTKSTSDISLGWNSMYIVGVILWVIYGAGINSRPLMIMASFEFLLATSLCILKLRYR